MKASFLLSISALAALPGAAAGTRYSMSAIKHKHYSSMDIMDMLACLCVSLQRIIGIVSYELKAKLAYCAGVYQADVLWLDLSSPPA